MICEVLLTIKNFLNKILYRLRLKQRPVLSREEQWRARGVTIGKNFDGPDSAIDFCFGHLVTIGDNVTIFGTTILAHDGSTKKFLGYSKVGPVNIGDNVFIGYGCIVLPNVTIGSKVIVGAGTVISRDIPDNVVVVQGTDSTYRVLCTFDEYIEKQRSRMETLPVSNILFTDRTAAQWAQWKQELTASCGGFDL